MVPYRMNAILLRPLVALFALAALLVLGGCGGGSGAPNNPYAPGNPIPGPVIVLPTDITVYSHTPATLTISGGSPPYQAFTSNTPILPVTQLVNGNTVVLLPNDVTADTVVTITLQDSISQSATAKATVKSASIFNTLTITPARTTCGANTVCSGDTATATVTVTGNGGAGIPNRQVKFDVISGAFFILTSNPAQPQVSTLTVVSDANGVASVVIQAAVNAPTQPGMLRVTDLTSGNSVNGVFTIVQSTNGTGILSVVPATATITGAFINQCSAGFRTDFYVYGGTPPYTVANTFPQAATLLNTIVPTAGGLFGVITNGTCTSATGILFTIVDSAGRQITATLVNQQGTATPPAPPTPAALAIAPTTAGTSACSGKTFQFLVTGGTPPYSAGAVTSPPQTPTVSVSNGTVSVSGLSNAASTTTLVVQDQSSPQKSVTATINCT
jgi:hypothetical protein